MKLNNFHTNSCDFTFAMLLHYWRWQLARSRFLCNWYNFPQARGLNYRKFKMRNNTCWSVKISRFKRSYYCRTYRCTVFENYRKSLIQHCERNELRLHFEWTKVYQKCQKWSILATFWIESFYSQITLWDLFFNNRIFCRRGFLFFQHHVSY